MIRQWKYSYPWQSKHKNYYSCSRWSTFNGCLEMGNWNFNQNGRKMEMMIEVVGAGQDIWVCSNLLYPIGFQWNFKRCVEKSECVCLHVGESAWECVRGGQRERERERERERVEKVLVMWQFLKLDHLADNRGRSKSWRKRSFLGRTVCMANRKNSVAFLALQFKVLLALQ